MSLHDVMVGELKDLYSAENQLVKTLPKMAKAAEDEELAASFREHLEQTKNHVERLKQVFGILGSKATGKHCDGMEGLIEEGKEAIEEDEEDEAYDIGLIGAALRVEHYEKAGYTCAIEMAKGLGHDDIAEILTETLDEESETADKLVAKLESLIEAAVQEPDADEDEEDGKPKTAKDRTSERKSKEDEKKAAPDLKKGSAVPAAKAPSKKK